MARQFGHSWWGQAWIDALENRADIDPNRLPRGRTYARHDRVARLELEAGRVTALVRGNRALPYRVVIGVRTFDDAAWDRLAGAIAAKAGHAAALLDGELEPEILTDARDAGIELLPAPGDLQPRCSCPDWADPCKHAAAVCYLVADALDADPFVLFALRGRDRDAVLAAIREHRQAAGTRAGDRSKAATRSASDGGALVDPGVLAREAWSGETRPSPHRPELPRIPGAPAAWPADPPSDAPFTAAGLKRLAGDAAARAWAQLAEGEPSGLSLSRSADLARRGATVVADGEDLAELARASGEPTAALVNRAAAWVHAGVEGLAAMDEPLWRPPTEVTDVGRQAFLQIGADPGEVRVRSNRISAGDIQLRVTTDGLWWRYEKRGRTWTLVEPPSDSPEDLLSARGRER